MEDNHWLYQWENHYATLVREQRGRPLYVPSKEELLKYADDHYFKNSEEGVASMRKVMEDMRNETALQKSKEIALRLISMGKLSHEEIAEASGLAIEVIKELAQQKNRIKRQWQNRVIMSR